MVLGMRFARVNLPPFRFDASAEDSISKTEKLAKTKMLELQTSITRCQSFSIRAGLPATCWVGGQSPES
jgi:hypothetical protein